MTLRVFTVFLVSMFAGICSDAAGMANDSSAARRSLILRHHQFTPAQVLTGDTLSVDSNSKIEIVSAPGSKEYPFTPEQDSAYSRLMRLSIPPGTLAQIHAKMYARGWEEELKNSDKQPWQIAMKMLELPAEYFMPSGQERVMHAYGIAQSQYVPNLSLYKNAMPGFQIPLSSIASFLGLEEDVSPVMQYVVEYLTEVQIVVYSPQAKVVATVLDGKQTPGKYRITWNGRDDAGRRLPPGDYVSEIRIGKERYVRKRIVLQ